MDDIVFERHEDEEMSGWATFSRTRLYRYALGREWSSFGPSMVWIMLNPSTADAFKLDPTIRRCVAFSKREGCGRLVVLNLFALRSPNPGVLLDVHDLNSPSNAEVWRSVLSFHDGPVVAAWGAFLTSHPETCPVSTLEELRLDTSSWLCLGTTKAGAPRHPLYVRGDAPLIPFKEGDR